ncbi:hypothetical protein NLG97_g1344 [Lecanicillium saksenae]|uniref:Uncharacterized protein n=1 Tax=Lecanicillium saksenae TaxID=468837 RepID=A0ACC1R5A7_9HYPO|nr:hypothetical protein NLG97_g1344 [Lecanicillium saksenae]
MYPIHLQRLARRDPLAFLDKLHAKSVLLAFINLVKAKLSVDPPPPATLHRLYDGYTLNNVQQADAFKTYLDKFLRAEARLIHSRIR